MSLANRITLARAALIPGVLVLLFLDQRPAAVALALLFCVGDVLDGMVARQRGEVTAWGKALDPIVDKTLYASLLASLTYLGEIPALAVVLFLVPQVGLGLGALVLQLRESRVQGARYVGKAAAGLTFLALGFLLLRWPARLLLLYVAIGATYLAGGDYLRAALRRAGDRRTDR